MVRLQAVVVKEIPEEVACRESEASLEVGDKDHPFVRFRCWHNLAGGKPTCHSNRDTPSVDDPVEVSGDNFRSVPTRAAGMRGRIILRRRRSSRHTRRGHRFGRDSRSPVMLALTERGRGKLAYFNNRELQMLVRKLDLPSKGNQVKIRGKYCHEELLRTPLQ
jgi:hypothetical protein